MFYKKPLLNSYTAYGIIEEMGAGQMQYEQTTVTLNPTATTDDSVDRGDLDGYISRTFRYGEKYGDDTVNTDGLFSSEGTTYQFGIIGGGDRAETQGVVHGGEYRGFIGFDISSIQSTVTSATLTIYQHGFFTGYGDPYSLFGDLIVEHINFGSELETTDFDSTALATVTTISDSSHAEKSIDVTDYVQNDLDNGRSYSQYRLRFTETFSDMSTDEQGYVLFSDSEDTFGDGNVPSLEITYY